MFFIELLDHYTTIKIEKINEQILAKQRLFSHGSMILIK